MFTFSKKNFEFSHFIAVAVVTAKLESFRLEYEYEIEYKYDFSNQLRSKNRRSSMLLTSREGDSRNTTGVTQYLLKDTIKI